MINQKEGHSKNKFRRTRVFDNTKFSIWRFACPLTWHHLDLAIVQLEGRYIPRSRLWVRITSIAGLLSLNSYRAHTIVMEFVKSRRGICMLTPDVVDGFLYRVSPHALCFQNILQNRKIESFCNYNLRCSLCTCNCKRHSPALASEESGRLVGRVASSSWHWKGCKYTLQSNFPVPREQTKED